MTSLQNNLKYNNFETNIERQMEAQIINQESYDYNWIDQFNSQNKILYSTSRWPNSPLLKKQLNIPLCLSLNPFEISEVQNSSFKKQQLKSYRCISCKAFINKLCIFKNPKNYVCSICGASNKLQKQFDVQSIQYRKMVYEAQASSQNYVKLTTPPTLILVIDVSRNAYESGFLINLRFAIKQLLKNIEKKQFYQIMIITFDKYVHYYDLKAQQLKRIILCDSESEKKIHILSEVQTKILQIIESIQDIAKNNNYYNQSILKAIELAYTASKIYSGRILVFSALQTKFAEATAINDISNMDMIQNHRFLQKKFSKQLKESMMSISFFIFSNKYINLIELYMITKITNGSLHHYNKNQLMKFYYELSTLLLSSDYYQVILKIRYSPGIKLNAVFGSYFNSRVSDQINLFTCSPNRNYIFQFDIEGKINFKYIPIQFTLLFANSKGQRKFRVINHIIKIQEDPLIILDHIDYSIVNYYYLKAASQSLDSKFEKKHIRQIIQQRCAKHIKYVIQKRQGKLDKKLSQYITLCYSFLKSKMLNMQYKQILQYEKVVEMRSIFLRAGYKQLLLRIYPFFYGIHKDQFSSDRSKQEQQQQYLLDPKQKQINSYNIVLIDKGDQLQVYLNIKSKSINKIFGDEKMIQNLDEEKLRKIQTPEIQKLIKFIQKLRLQKQSSYQNLNIVTQIDQNLIFNEQTSQNYKKFVNQLTK